MFEIPCVILSGGKSSRMQEDKSLLPFGGYGSLAEYQYSRLKNMFKEVYVSCKNPSKYLFKGEFIEDVEDAFSPFLGIRSAFYSLGIPYIFFITVDSPFISEKSIKKVVDAMDCKCDGVLMQEGERVHNLIGIYTNTLLPKIEKLEQEGNYKVGALVGQSGFKYVSFESSDEFLNLNRKEEYQKALKVIDLL